MLAQRRPHLPPQQHHHHSASTLLSPPEPQTFSLEQLSQNLPVQQLYDQKLLNDYLESQQLQTFAAVDNNNPFMTGAYDFANPSIRIQQSPQVTASFSPTTSMLSANATASPLLDHWNTYNHVHGGNQQPMQRIGRSHERTPSSSSSSVGSSGSQYQATATAPVATTSFPAFSTVASQQHHHLPTPTHTPTQDSFINTNTFHNKYTPHTASMDSTMAAHMSMKQALMDQHVPEEDVPGFVHSARHSVSSYGHDSPATPHTTHGDEMDFKMGPSDLRQHTVVPKIERMYTDVTADYSFDPNAIVTSAPSLPPQAKPVANRLLSPYRTSNPASDLIQRSLQAAQMARSQSPTSSVSRGDSPFRRGSPYRQPNTSFQSPRMAVGSAAAAREKKVEADAAYAMKPHIPSAEDAQPKTISPKDAMLDYREANDESKAPLFPDSGASEYNQYNGADQFRNVQSTFDTTSQSYRRDSWATPHFSSGFSTTSVAGTSQPSSFAFAAPPSMSGNLTGLPLMSASQYRPAHAMSAASDQTPEFPAHLTSMESSASETGPEPTRQSSEQLLQKPADSNADTGTYTCTYHGCTLRFETPQKLQKHKREGHRNTANLGSSMTSAALLERNSQAGPHKCDRINPTTGKPCNTIFSRPYDLTRHEDTIHNARKQKVRCALCVEEKTFSRNDALTRHMRVVHPEVDFPGKHKRRGANHD